MALTGPALDSTNGYTLGGAMINADGSWTGGVQSDNLRNERSTWSIMVPPISAQLLVTQGANTLLANDGGNTTSWTASTNWTDGEAPHFGANYFTLTNLLRTPTTGSNLTFAGDSLTIGPSVPGNTSFRLELPAPGGTYIVNNCTNAGGAIDAGVSNATNCLSGTHWFIAAPSSFGFSDDNTRAIILTNLNMSGSFTLSNGVADLNNGLGTIVYAGNAANFTGPIVTSLGTTLQAYSQTNLGGNPAGFNPAQLVLDNATFQPLASMALTNSNSGVTLGPGGGTFNISPGLTLTVVNPIAGTGNLTNRGGGLLVLSGTNDYSGATLISSGTLMVNGAVGTNTVTVAPGALLGGSGVVGGAVTVQSGGTIQAGNSNGAGTLTVGTLNLGDIDNASTSSRFSIASGGTISATTLNVTGTHTINILDSSLAVGTNTLITCTGTMGGGGFAALQLGALPTLPAWATAYLTNSGSTVQLVVRSLPLTGIRIGALSRFGTNMVMSGAGGATNGTYYVLTTTNVALPVTNWSGMATGAFDGDGNFSFTNAIDLTGRAHFLLILESP